MSRITYDSEPSLEGKYIEDVQINLKKFQKFQQTIKSQYFSIKEKEIATQHMGYALLAR